jgi:hypothetical protein
MSRPPAAALGALVQDKLGARESIPAFSKVDNHMTLRIYTNQEGFHFRRLLTHTMVSESQVRTQLH